MAKQDTKRIQHDLTKTLGRDQPLEQVVNDIFEYMAETGYQSVARNGSEQIETAIIWQDDTQTLKRADVTVTRSSPPFVSQVVTQVYDELGTTVVAVLTQTIARNGNNAITSVDAEITRP